MKKYPCLTYVDSTLCAHKLDVKLYGFELSSIVKDDNWLKQFQLGWKWEPKYIFGKNKRGPRGSQKINLFSTISQNQSVWEDFPEKAAAVRVLRGNFPSQASTPVVREVSTQCLKDNQLQSQIIYHLVVLGRDPNDPMARVTKDIKEFNRGETCF